MEQFKTHENDLMPAATSLRNSNAQYYDMVVFCHLRWQLVYQRPQHIIIRMAKDLKVLLIEEPISFEEADGNTGILTTISPQLHILQPKVNNIEAIAEIIPKYISNTTITIGWFYSASFSPMLGALQFDTVVYDCMDELSLFKGAPQIMIDQEKFLLSNADVVFTEGKSLYESKKQLHYNVHCFPSSVDEPHFAQARNGIAIPKDIAGIKWPIVGYFGVIDERIDLDLIRQSACRLPDVSFVMIGPLVKVEVADLPKAKNIHYLGIKTYEELPAYLKAFDIAMLPFVLNDATKFINPTKTLEFMAAGKPIVSTRIKDVERDYSHCVKLIETAEEFCEAISEVSQNNLQRSIYYKEILINTSWDSTVAKMKAIIKNFAL